MEENAQRHIAKALKFSRYKFIALDFLTKQRAMLMSKSCLKLDNPILLNVELNITSVK